MKPSEKVETVNDSLCKKRRQQPILPEPVKKWKSVELFHCKTRTTTDSFSDHEIASLQQENISSV